MNATRHVQVDKREANGSFRRSRNHYFYLASPLPDRMKRLRTRASFAIALSAQLAIICALAAPGVVLCVEQDGRVSLEASAAGGVCGGASTGSASNSLSIAASVSPHCIDCRDVPLQLADFMARERQRIAAQSPGVAVALPVFPRLQPARQIQIPVPTPSTRVPWSSISHTTVLRI